MFYSIFKNRDMVNGCDMSCLIKLSYFIYYIKKSANNNKVGN